VQSEGGVSFYGVHLAQTIDDPVPIGARSGLHHQSLLKQSPLGCFITGLSVAAAQNYFEEIG
jgi:hypothetical protein